MNIFQAKWNKCCVHKWFLTTQTQKGISELQPHYINYAGNNKRCLCDDLSLVAAEIFDSISSVLRASWKNVLFPQMWRGGEGGAQRSDTCTISHGGKRSKLHFLCVITCFYIKYKDMRALQSRLQTLGFTRNHQKRENLVQLLVSALRLKQKQKSVTVDKSRLVGWKTAKEWF